MSEENLDLNLEEEVTSEGSGQPETKPSSVEADDTSKEADGDAITLSKEEYEKLVADKENYKKGLLSLKEKSKTKPVESGSEFLPKKDFYKANEKEAIQKFVNENPDIKADWTEFVKHYADKRGRDTVNAILQDLDDAKTIYEKYQPKEDEDKEAKANLSSESSTPVTSGGGVKPEKGGILPRKTPITEWYKTD